MPNKKEITKKEREGDGSKWNRESYERGITLAQLAGAMMQQVKEPKPRNTNDRVDGENIHKRVPPWEYAGTKEPPCITFLVRVREELCTHNDHPLRIESTRIHNAKHMSDGYISL